MSDLSGLLKRLGIEIFSKDDVEINGGLYLRGQIQAAATSFSAAQQLGYRVILQLMDEYEEPKLTEKPSRKAEGEIMVLEPSKLIETLRGATERVEELAHALQKERESLAAYSQVHLRQVSKLQAARELAGVVSHDARVHPSIQAMAREFLKILDEAR